MKFFRQLPLFDHYPFKKRLPVNFVMFATEDGPVFRDISEADRRPSMPALKGSVHLTYPEHYAVVYLTNGDAVIVMNDRLIYQKDGTNQEFKSPYPGNDKKEAAK